MKIEHIYIISLDTSDEFVNSAVDKLNKSNLPNKTGYTIMPAVNGINDIIHRDNVRKFGVSLYENWKLQNTDKEFWAREMSVGEIGCVLSHINVWKDAYKNGYGNVLILEEDFEPSEIKDNKLTAIYHNYDYIAFVKNSKLHNDKNAAYIYEHKDFRLNGKYYSNQNKFTKKSWRRFVKLQAFL